MLHKKFKPAKCKTSLKLASSRIKLMRNKREAQVKQLKRELAQLLESGQEQTARIRVEHVVREEKTMAAYDLIEIYCELIVARLPIIESQKTCPIDLKEAISSVIYASPRCADIPELADVRKHLTAKYGKEFVSAAVELRPDCGVGRMLVEKLSAKAPDGPAKIKILTAIAEEHNIKWDPKAFGEKDLKAPVEFLGGPNSFMQASFEAVVPPNVQSSSNSDDTGRPGDRIPSKPNESHNVPMNYNDQNARSQHPQSAATTNAGVHMSNSSSSSHSRAGRPGTLIIHPTVKHSFCRCLSNVGLTCLYTGSETEDVAFGHSNSQGGDASTFRGENWNMEFKDATAAAQAAAESAERASMAAKAAAEIASRGNSTRQHSTESCQSSAYGTRDENRHLHTSSTPQGGSRAKVSKDDALPGRNPRMQHEKFRGDEENKARAAELTNLDGPSANMSGQPRSFKSSKGFVNEHWVLKQSGSIDEVNTKKQPSGVEFNNKGNDDEHSVDDHYFEEIKASRQSSRASSRSHSHSSTFDCAHVVSDETHHDLDNPFADYNGLQVEETTHAAISHQNESVVFDYSESDDDQYKFDVLSEHKEHEFEYGFSSSGGKSPFLDSGIHSLRQSNDEIKKVGQPATPVTFDDTDGPSSESEEEQGNLHVGPKDQSTLNYQHLSSSSLTDKPESKFGRGDGTSRQSSLSDRNSQNDDNRDSLNSVGDVGFSRVYDVPPKEAELLKESSLEGVNKLSFGTLTGGLRNKGLKRPPYTKSSAGIAPASKLSAESTVNSTEAKKKTATNNEFRDVDSGVKLSQQISNSNENFPNGKHAFDVRSKRPTSRTSIKYFDSEDEDSEEDTPKQASSSSLRPIGGISRRTKATPLSSRRSSDSRTTVLPQSSQKNSRDGSGSSDRPQYQTKAASKSVLESKRNSSEESSRPSVRQQAVSESKSSEHEKPSDSPAATEILRTSSSSAEKASHVHPKLPDYDSFAAHFESLRLNRK
ncbi:uncharacterized protein [Rutidosis leptorrhynchoides]|uniref:uncharacterized protein n=1 Tax=Rutidosis leptorrhynchoides TaxID=125765 RepID=UPI003A991CE5